MFVMLVMFVIVKAMPELMKNTIKYQKRGEDGHRLTVSTGVKSRNDVAAFVCEDIFGVEVILLDPALA